ncbi:S4 domain-containing protein YaaA [Virgibacillus sp. W0430]|uniref:S4 domain-containing protein YaaA n=1 Tax=Virgibacillus sp. W0430 TaxID=3391580 RepID=UPI003F45A253
MEKIPIHTPYITLSQLLKLANIFDSGGMIKAFLQDEGVYVNGELEHRRGRKLYPNDVVAVGEVGKFIVVHKE